MSRLLVALVSIGVGCGRAAPLNQELRARDEYVRGLAEREGLTDAWSLMSRSTIVFDDGLTPIEIVDPEVGFPGWKEISRTCVTGRGQAVRWMGPRAHIRVRGESAMRLEIFGRADVKSLYTRPLITASFDGVEFHSGVVEPDGFFTITAEIQARQVASWADVYVLTSSVHEPWRDLSQLKVIRLEHVVWEAVTEAEPGG